jgi:hypothetical protein
MSVRLFATPVPLFILHVVFFGVLPDARAEETAESIRTIAPEDTVTEEDASGSPFSMNYTNILYGPSLSKPSSYLPSEDGTPDPNRAVYMRNFLSASYAIGDVWAVTATAYWWHRPVLGQQFTMQDPFVRLSNSSLFSTDWGLNLYSDVRLHPGFAQDSRDANMVVGLQNFNYLSFQPENWPVALALRASARYNVYGKKGYGTETEFYIAPEATFRFSEQWAITALYEMGSSRQNTDRYGYFGDDGSDFAPGIEWDPTPDIVVNPYVTMLTGGKATLASTSVGVFFTWSFL